MMYNLGYDGLHAIGHFILVDPCLNFGDPDID